MKLGSLNRQDAVPQGGYSQGAWDLTWYYEQGEGLYPKVSALWEHVNKAE